MFQMLGVPDVSKIDVKVDWYIVFDIQSRD